MKYINRYLRNFKPYTLASHKVWNVDSKTRKSILKLDWNEATIPPSPLVNRRIEKLIENGDFYNLYPSTYNKELLELLCKYVGLPVENIQYFASSDSLHEYIAKLYITVGDPVLLLGPTYDNFRLTAEVCGAKVFYYNISDDFVFDANEFEKQIDTVEPSLVYICNPNNPTGTSHTVEYIESLLIKYPQTLFLVDEAYCEFSGVSSKNLVLKHENILISRTMSKAFALANFRFGYLIASSKNIEYISTIRNPKNITTFAQEAAMGALNDVPYMLKYVEEVNKARMIFTKELFKWQDLLTPVEGYGNFVLIRCKTEKLKKHLIDGFEKENVFVRNVSQTDFIKKYCFRVTIGTLEQMKYVADLIKKLLDDYYE